METMLVRIPTFLLFLAAVSALGAKPNIVLILADDMNYAGPSCYGERWGMETPAIDRLAAEGVLCTDAYVTSPTCGPSRAGLITGRMQTRFGAEFNAPRAEGVGLPLTETTLATRLKDLGYATGIVGKWHLGGDADVGAAYHPLRRGFDEFFGFHGSMVHYFRSAHLYRGHEPVREPGYLTDVLARESCAFIERRAGHPFFLYVAFNAPHTPLEATAEDLAAVRALPPPAGQREALEALPTEDREAALETIAVRRAMLRALDRAVGQIMDQLDQSGLTQDTLVIFTNDNGDYTSNGPFRGGKGVCQEGGIRVPMIWRWPGRLPEGAVYSEMVSTLDIVPTAVAAAGGAIDPDWRLDGVNLLPYLSGDASGAPHEWLFWRMGENRAARNGPWKLFYSGFSGFYSQRHGMAPPDPTPNWALFNLAQDPGEKHDLKDKHPERFANMRKAYAEWEAEQVEPRWPFGPSGQMGQYANENELDAAN